MTSLAWRGRSVDLEADDAADLRWLAWWTAPTFAADPRAAPVGRVRMVRDTDRVATLRSQAAGATAHVAGTLDRGPLELPGRRIDGTLLLADDARGAVLAVAPTGDVEVVAAPCDARARLTLLRVVRELLVHPDLSLLHAAAVEVDGRAIVLAGPRRAGKTTLLLHLLAGGRARLVANDCLALVADGTAHGVPTVVRVRTGSADLVPTPPSAPGRSFVLHPDEAAQHLRPTDADGWHLAPPILAEAFATTVAASAPVGAVLVLDNTGPPGLRRLGADAAAAALADARFGTAMPITALHRPERGPTAATAPLPPVLRASVSATDLADPDHAEALVAQALGCATVVGR